MKTVILIHGLHMHSLSLSLMKKTLQKLDNVNIQAFNYNSLLFDFSIIKKLHLFVNQFDINDEIVLVGHSMGGLIARLYLTQHQPKREIKLITLGTPHYGSEVAKVINKTPLKIFLGTSGKSGIIDEIPSWGAEYKMICIAGIKKFGIVKLFLPHLSDPNDGTVFVKEAILENAHEKIILEDIHHIQLITNQQVINEVIKWV